MAISASLVFLVLLGGGKSWSISRPSITSPRKLTVKVLGVGIFLLFFAVRGVGGVDSASLLCCLDLYTYLYTRLSNHDIDSTLNSL